MSPSHYQPIDSAVTPRFAEPATFMRTPHVSDYDGLDIGLVGVPFDLGSTNRAGARHGPSQIREMSRLIRKVETTDEMVDEIERALLGDGSVHINDVIVIISGAPMWVTGTTNLMKLHRVGERR